MKLLIASNNQHKIEEIKAILNEHFDDITSLGEEHIECEPEETGKTFEENALIKARATAKLTNLAVLADDTGLCVNALGGKPGIYSARYASSHNSLSNRQKLLSEMHGIKDRSAYFECVVVLRYPDGKEVFGKDELKATFSTMNKAKTALATTAFFTPRNWASRLQMLQQRKNYP